MAFRKCLLLGGRGYKKVLMLLNVEMRNIVGNSSTGFFKTELKATLRKKCMLGEGSLVTVYNTVTHSSFLCTLHSVTAT